MKKVIYVILFVVLGIIVSFFVHALIEIPVIVLLVSDFEKWGLGLSWGAWETIHDVGAIILLILGIVYGFRQGKHWWKVIYNDK